jgi:hypothetical protein
MCSQAVEDLCRFCCQILKSVLGCCSLRLSCISQSWRERDFWCWYLGLMAGTREAWWWWIRETSGLREGSVHLVCSGLAVGRLTNCP